MQANRTPLPVRVRDSPTTSRVSSMLKPQEGGELVPRLPSSEGSRVVYSPGKGIASAPHIASIQDQIDELDVSPITKTRASPRTFIPRKELTTQDLNDLVANVLSSPQPSSKVTMSPSSKVTMSPTQRKRTIATPTRTPSTNVPTSRPLSANAFHRPAPRSVTPQPSSRQGPKVSTVDDQPERRQGPVVITMDTQLPEVRSAMTQEFSMAKQPQPDNMIVRTPYGQFVIPNYDLMCKRDIDMAMQSYVMKFNQINGDWKHTGNTFDGPRPDEDIVRVAVRYLETEKFLSTQTGTDFWFIILCALWAFIEYQAKSYKLPADGYTESQIGMYKMYQSQLIRMGTVSNVGAEWPPWLQVCVTSGFSLAILVLMSKFGVGGYSGQVMKEISSMISGNRNVDVSSAGTVKPSEGGIVDMVKGIASGGGISTMMSLFTSMTGGGSTSKKTTKKKKDKQKASKAAMEAADVDI